MVVEHLDDFSSEWAAIISVSSKLGVMPETLRVWVRRAQVGGGSVPDSRVCPGSPDTMT
jgi:transposase-like protein